MSDNDDLIQRGDALAECQKVADEAKSYGIPQMSMGAHSCRDAIRAIPAVHPVASDPQDATLGRESCMSAHPSPDVAGLVEALGAEYVLDHPLETSEERMGRHSAVRGIAVRMGCYPQLEAGIITALAAIKEPKT